MRRLLSTIISAGAICAIAGAQSGLPMIQPDAGAVFGIEWRRLLDSPAGKALKDQLNKPEMAQIPQFHALKNTLLNNLDSIVIAAPLTGLKAGTQPPPLVVVKGRFQVASLRSLILGKRSVFEKYRTVELLLPSDSGPSGKNDSYRVALLDGNTILAGDRGQVRAAIDRIQTGRLVQSQAGILEGVAELAAANDVWMVFTVPPNAAKDTANPMTQLYADVKSAQLGMSFREGLALGMNVRTKDNAAATQVAQALQGLVGMAALSGNPKPEQVEMLKKFKITPEGSQVKISLALNQAELDKMIRESQAMRQTSQPAPGTTLISRPAEPAGPKTIRITGLDSGPVEIPLAGAQ